jgi:arylsulfatase A-like enzyme
VTRGALGFLEQASRTEAPFLLLAQYSDARAPYLVHERARLPERAPESLASSVDALVPEGVGLDLLQVISADPSAEERAFLEAMRREDLLATDRAIGELIDSLPRLGLAGSTWIVISGGHGSELFEQGWVGDGHSAAQALLHVPWIVVPPGPRRAPRRVATTVSLASLAPTLADLLDVPFDGGPFPSLEGVLRGEALQGEGFAPFEVDHELASGPPRSPVAHLRGAVAGEWKWIEDLTLGRGRLVHPASDPSESRDRSAEEPLRAQQLALRLERVRRPASP